MTGYQIVSYSQGLILPCIKDKIRIADLNSQAWVVMASMNFDSANRRHGCLFVFGVLKSVCILKIWMLRIRLK